MDLYLKVTWSMGNLKVAVSWYMAINNGMKASLKMEWNMARVNIII
jgi:hypothetical protein